MRRGSWWGSTRSGRSVGGRVVGAEEVAGHAGDPRGVAERLGQADPPERTSPASRLEHGRRDATGRDDLMEATDGVLGLGAAGGARIRRRDGRGSWCGKWRRDRRRRPAFPPGRRPAQSWTSSLTHRRRFPRLYSTGKGTSTPPGGPARNSTRSDTPTIRSRWQTNRSPRAVRPDRPARSFVSCARRWSSRPPRVWTFSAHAPSTRSRAHRRSQYSRWFRAEIGG